MSPDLVALGDHLEDAVKRAIERRRARRQSVLNIVATFLIALPIALAAATADLTERPPSSIGEGSSRPVLQWTTDYAVAGSRLPVNRGPRVIPTVRCPERSACIVRSGPHIPRDLKRIVR